ncbi:MAG: DUF433 domain-containing protein [Planctomycetota bacterium]|nr:DUF433 domain-containing protein [Planctomycetota bacterium]
MKQLEQILERLVQSDKFFEAFSYSYSISGMSTATATYMHLAPNPRSSYKQLFVKGTRIRARAIYSWYACEEPMTPEEIAADYSLPVEAVRECIAYCESDPPELQEDYAREEALAQTAASTIRNIAVGPNN